MRVQKFLSRAGVASRREAEALLAAGRIRINGEVVTVPGTRVDPDRDRVEVDGTRVRIPAIRWILFHKPPDVVTTRHDPQERRTVYDLLPPELAGLHYVGRLDRETEGLLLLTNEGDAAHGLLHPSRRVSREYEAVVTGRPDDTTAARLEEGVELEDGPARAEDVRIEGPDDDGRGTVVRLVLREGRKREVRRLMEAVGHRVLRLRRIRFGPVELGDVPAGAWRDLDEEEVEGLRRVAEVEPKG